MSTTEDQRVAEVDPAANLAARRHRLEPGGAWVGPFAHLAAERARLGSLRWEHFEARQLGATLGAEISGIDLAVEPPHEVVAELRRALLDYKVLFFRDQPLTPERHVAFARRFGELEVHPFLPGAAGNPELVRFEKDAEVAGYENVWHHDVTWREHPSMGAVLHAVSVPAVGGDTHFADMYAVYEGLEPELRHELDGLSAVHDFMKAFGASVPPDRLEETRARYPEVVHPVVHTHPETGRRALYVNRVFTREIVGLDADASAALLDRLYREPDNLEYQVRFRWEDDSVAFWDNRAVQHYAASDYFPDSRIMERASIVGGRPA
ncbi:MAG: TauD/TfdA family dioxygenase [Acidimicrobiales bacterium]|jgi:taurine dioxygenase|nr:TauD/TfdA family dioxygenase [Acidimicrobiales bacterium]